MTNIVKNIIKKYPESTIINLGEQDIFIDYKPKVEQKIYFIQLLKVIFICMVVFSGSAIAIMSFYNDAQIPKVLITFHKIIFNEETKNPLLINLSFSCGLLFGMTMFFNHIFGKKITDDPTPIEIEMSLYENEVTDVLIDYLNTSPDSNDK